MSAVPQYTGENPESQGAAIEFLSIVHPDDLRVLWAKQPDGKGIDTQTFTPEQKAETSAWIAKYNSVWNLYYHLNPVLRPLSSKAKKADVKEVTWLHVDLDPRTGENMKDEQDRILALAGANLPKGVPGKPTLVIFSGGGYQFLWKLAQPIPINGDEKLAEEVERYTRQLEMLFVGADHTHNVDRVLRLVGTINIPDKTKREKGRVRAGAYVVEYDPARVYPESAFAKAPPDHGGGVGAGPTATDIDALPISLRMKNLIRGIDDREHAYESRSERVFAVLVAMATNGCSDEGVEAIFLDPTLPISAHVREQSKPRDYLARQIAKARKVAVDPAVAKLNENYALVLLGDKAAIMRQSISTENDSDMSFISLAAFREWHGNRFVTVGKKRMPLGEHWLKHPQRRQYEGIIFAPGRDALGYYNLWRGFAVEPKAGDCSKFKAHLSNNVCRGDDTLFQWVFGWFAAIVQRPEAKMGTSLVIRGPEGTGKTKVGEIIGSLFGPHYVSVSDPRYITGRFNAHLVSCVLLHAEEAFWAGDHTAEGKLKDLITGETHLVEFKGKEPIRVKNFVRLFVTGNPDWVVPVALEGRRFAVLEIGEARMKDAAYFAAIDEEANHGGRAALLHELLNFDLNTVNLREVPKTGALLDQKINSLTAEQGWLLDLLQSGQLPFGTGYASGAAATMLFDSYIMHANKRGVRRRSIETQVGVFLRKVLPDLQRREGTYRQGDFDIRGSLYDFPALADCRVAFEGLVGQRITWHGPNEWLDPPERSAQSEPSARSEPPFHQRNPRDTTEEPM